MVALLTLTLACEVAQRGPDGQESVERDSAGIRVLTHGSAALDAIPLWKADRLLTTIGDSDETRDQLQQVVGAVFLPDGAVAVGDGGSEEILLFGADGSFLNSLGRRGAGPGEFRSLRWVGTTADSLVVGWDIQNARVTAFRRAGKVVAEVTTLDTSAGSAPGQTSFVGMFTDGSFATKTILDVEGYRNRAETIVRDSLSLRFFDREGRVRDGALRVAGSEQYLVRTETGFGTTPLIFGRDAHVAVSGAHLIVGMSDSFELRFYDLAGSLGRIVRLEQNPTVASDEVVEAERTTRLDRIAMENAHYPPIVRLGLSQFESIAVRKVPAQRTLPAFFGITADHLGRIWVERGMARDTASWLMFGPEGDLQAELRLPKSWKLVDAVTDRVLVLEVDELDVQRLHVRELASH